MGRRGRGRQQAWGRGVENDSLVFVRTLGRTLRSAMGGYPTLGPGAWRHPPLQGPPLALPLTRSPGTLRAEFPFRRITRRTPQFTLTSPSPVSMCLYHNCHSWGNQQGVECRTGICNVLFMCAILPPRLFTHICNWFVSHDFHRPTMRAYITHEFHHWPWGLGRRRPHLLQALSLLIKSSKQRQRQH